MADKETKFNPDTLLAGAPTHINPITQTTILNIGKDIFPKTKAAEPPPLPDVPGGPGRLYDGTDPIEAPRLPLGDKPGTRRV